jgi:hypothetical protein
VSIDDYTPRPGIGSYYMLRVKLIPVNPPLWINAVDGQPPGTGLVTRLTESITLQIGLI